MKGFDRKLPSRPRHLSLAHVGRCSSVVTLVLPDVLTFLNLSFIKLYYTGRIYELAEEVVPYDCGVGEEGSQLLVSAARVNHCSLWKPVNYRLFHGLQKDIKSHIGPSVPPIPPPTNVPSIPAPQNQMLNHEIEKAPFDLAAIVVD